MELLKQYFDLQRQIHEYFGYEEDWKVIPLDDQTGMYWAIEGDEVFWAHSEEDFRSGDYYGGVIYTQRFLPQYVYEGEQYTMVSVDTQSDGNKFLIIFSNDMLISNDTLATLLVEDDEVDDQC